MIYPFEIINTVCARVISHVMIFDTTSNHQSFLCLSLTIEVFFLANLSFAVAFSWNVFPSYLF